MQEVVGTLLEELTYERECGTFLQNFVRGMRRAARATRAPLSHSMRRGQRKLLEKTNKALVEINDGLSLALAIKDERERVACDGDGDDDDDLTDARANRFRRRRYRRPALCRRCFWSESC